jgi:DNA-binding winged helix-turn-helix (wHTH) protein
MDLASQRLWHGDVEIRLRPKSWDVLRYLVERPGLLVTKEALHGEVWRDTAVSDDVLTQSIGELRRALGDATRTPRFIETVHGRGFRFVARVHDAEEESARTAPVPAPFGGPAPSLPFVGRRAELATLDECLARALDGARQTVFITGEAGIGKTTLVQAFDRSARPRGRAVHVLHGQCVQQYGQREPYMPLLEAVERLLSSAAGEPLIPLLRRVAPRWYAQIPSIHPADDPAASPRAPAPGAPERMLREMGTFLEVVAARSAVVLVLEDLHWSDTATVDLLAFLAQRPDRARLFIIGTYRAAEASVHEHPVRELKQALRVRRRCTEIALDYLSAADVREYMAARFGERVEGLAPAIHGRTDGNPLFVVALIDEMIRRGDLREIDGHWSVTMPVDGIGLAIPDDVLEMIALQLHSLRSDERAVLDAASVAGVEIEAHVLAKAIGRDPEAIEPILQRLVRSHRFLVASPRAPDDASGQRYQFVHAVYQQVLYGQVPEHRCRRLHQAIGETLESDRADGAADIASQLSMHFEGAGDVRRAVRYMALCVARAQERFAHVEAIRYAQHAIGLLERLADRSDRDARELELRLLLGVSLSAVRGYTSEDVKDNYQRARILCESVGDARQLFQVVTALRYARIDGTEAEVRRGLDELWVVAERAGAADIKRQADLLRGRAEVWSGNFGRAVRLLSACVTEEAERPPEAQMDAYGVHPVVGALAQYALALWFVGCPDQARIQADRALAYAQKLGRPFDLAASVCQSAALSLFSRDSQSAALEARRALAVCAEHHIANFIGPSRLILGSSLAAEGDLDAGISEMERSLIDQRATSGAFFCDVILASLASAYGRAGRWEEALDRVEEGLALSEARYERIYAAELWRIKGGLLAARDHAAKGGKVTRSGAAGAAEACVRRALEIARQQEARSLELRAAMSLARLPLPRNRALEARELVRSVYASFAEGFDTKDLLDARALLVESDA